MPRRRVPARKSILPDARYNSVVVAKFITRMMLDGKKTTSCNIMYEALETVGAKVEGPVLDAFLKALENVKPLVEVKSRRVVVRPTRCRLKSATAAARPWRCAG